ncbi:uncharacterized protein DUF3857 [Mucilaginibacter gracilis]|uniref:Uncharacterized protein DUF3857 n=1 Tax=Mucilaginibacter gracilis TaxID=423350 RepID=A0A495J6L1_9SPHI|nr:DUF3857 domain-containing protein [Mucilaginibacter gracilis]RKR84252.1 uncharacterized protein DUF3857 [Mucilaginibacter gracilis]
MRYFYTILFFLPMLCYGQQSNYDVNLIPKELLAHASAVIRNDETIVDVRDVRSVVTHYKKAITVLNKNGDEKARLVVEHDKIDQIKYIKGTVYDDAGRLIGKIAERDFEDQNAADGFSLFNGDMIKHYKPAIATYPYTIEYDCERNSKQSLFLNDWHTGQSIGTSVMHSSYKLTCKPDFNIRYKEFNYPGKVVTTEAQGFQTYTWAIDNLKALRYEPFSPDEDKLITSVKMAPEKFFYDGVSGSFTNWNEYGKWIYDKLLKDRRQLPPETIQHIKDLTANVTDSKQKAKLIYEYMQQKTRYISVQIGIGGYQPFSATDVDQSSYGDCKALVNYTQSLLSVAGIESYYILVKSGNFKASALPDFASMNQFDHVILCLPFKNDTTWLECTEKHIPFGYLGDFTDDRNVVACTPEGGKLLHTPVYKTNDNKKTRKATFILSPSGELSGEMTTKFEGTLYDERDELVNESYSDQVKALKEIYPIENLDIKGLELKQDKAIKPVTTETIKLSARDYMAQNGTRFFITPNTASRNIKPVKDILNRANPVYVNRGYRDEDEIIYTLPAGFKVSTINMAVNIDKPFGRYTVSTKVEGNKLIYKRLLQLNDGTYSKDVYPDMVDFYQSIYDTDNATLTMEKM